MYDTNGELAKGSWNLTTHDMVRLKKQLMLANEGDVDAIAVIKAESEKNDKLMKEITEEQMDKVVQEANKSNFTAAEIMKKKLQARKHQLEEEEKAEAEKDVVTKKPLTEEKHLSEELTNEIENDVEDEDAEESKTTSENESVPAVSLGPVKSGVIDTDEAVKLYEPGFRERYYKAKCYVSDAEIEPLRKGMVRSYVEGVSWVLLYYYQGCASWDWYYPYHYAPFASDFFDITNIKVEFELGKPFLPYEQLMSVLPAASGHTLPAIFRPLMSEPDSPIIDFYPTEFPIDMNGKKMSWQGISLLPFIDEKRLLETVRDQYPKLTPAERSRNVCNDPVLLISNKNANFERFTKKFYKTENEDEVSEFTFHHFKSGLSGVVSADKEGFKLGSKIVSPVQGGGLPDLSTNLLLKLCYKLVPLPSRNKSIILNGYIPSEQVLDAYDLDSVMYKYNNNGRNRWNFGNDMKQNKAPVGPQGTTQYKPRVGGYRAFFFFGQQNISNMNNGYQNGGNNANQNQYHNQQNRYNSGGRGNYQSNSRGSYQGGSRYGGNNYQQQRSGSSGSRYSGTTGNRPNNRYQGGPPRR